MPLPTEAATAIQRYVKEKPNGGYGPRDYRFEDHGLDAAAEREKVRPYLLRFGIAAESLPAGRRTQPREPVHVVKSLID